MCGLAGFLDPHERIADSTAAMAAMSEAIRHRGPDGAGSLFDPRTRLALVHRRLAIQDPSENGAQPMISTDGRFEIIYNGEIYDFPARRAELEAAGRRFRTETDTEVLLAGFEHWGIEATLDRVDGMFAFAVHDRERRELVLARDRAGQKPLLLAEVSGVVAFASDLRALEVLPEPLQSRLQGVDETSLDWFLRLGVVPWPRSIRPGVEQVAPGGLIRIDVGTGRVERTRWWSPPLPESARDHEAPGGDPRSADSRPIEEVLRESVHLCCRADRPLGVFLSGGIDSRLVAALAAEAVPGLPAFTLANDGPFDESAEAAVIANRLGLEHHVIRVDDRTLQEAVLDIPAVADEPFADSSIVATTLLARAARERIVVALGGDGGDELFGGYRRHAVAHAGGRLGFATASLIDALPRGLTGRVRIGRHSLADAALRRRRADPRVLDHEALRSTQGDAAHLLEPLPGDPGALDVARRSVRTSHSPWDGVSTPIRNVRDLMAADFRTYLPDDPLAKVDRATMSVGLEYRAPLLGRDVITAAGRIPTSTMFDLRGGRAPIRTLLRRLGLDDGGAKRGFAVPIFEWLRGPLRDHAASLLLEPAEDPLSPTRLDRLFHEVQSGRRDRATACWTALCWRAWLRARSAPHSLT